MKLFHKIFSVAVVSFFLFLLLAGEKPVLAYQNRDSVFVYSSKNLVVSSDEIKEAWGFTS